MRLLTMLDRHGTWLRLTLVLVSLVLLTLGWIVPLFLSEEAGKSWHFLRALAALPAALWGGLDAVWAQLKKRSDVKLDKIHADIYEILRELETLAVNRNTPLRLSECGLKVWLVGRRTLRDRWNNENRAPLIRIAASPFHLPSYSSGLDWRVGMGVMGVALRRNKNMAVDMDEAWSQLADENAESWAELPVSLKFGLTYEQFLRVNRASANGPSGPFVMCTPIYSRDRPRAITALDMPAPIADQLGLGGVFDDPDGRVLRLLYACTQRAIEK